MNINNNQHSIQTIAWEKICRPKGEGGLGIRKRKNVNATSYETRLKNSSPTRQYIGPIDDIKIS